MHIPRSRELAPKIDPVTVDHHASSQHTVLAICNKARDAACATPIQVFDFANQSIERLAFSKTLPHEVRTAMGSLIEKSHTVVIGGGVVGSCIAYFITSHPRYDRESHTVTVLEASSIGGGASGKAGGIIAAWADPSCLAPLSYRLHCELSETHGGMQEWGFRNVYCADVDAMGEAVGHAATDENLTHFHSHAALSPSDNPHPPELDWITPNSITSYTELGRPENTAQVHPHLFTNKIADLAREQGANYVMGSAISIDYTPDGSQAESVSYKAKGTSAFIKIDASDVVVAAGPWTKTLLPEAPIIESRNHSIVVRPQKPVSAYVLFPELHPKIPQKRIPPEIYSRPDGTIYSCAPSDRDVPLPETTDLVDVNLEICDRIYHDVSSISQTFREGEIVSRQACYRPFIVGRARDIGPLVGPTGIKSLWLASGHDSWGISNGPGTGKVISEMMIDGKASSADVSSLDPRLMLQKGA
ncbi:MAG: hypothetical protein LQ343_004565 [Gyalolechia ehrenbergii]|nr:MAG: hypothetical protein LQ343_004565 [Gyalolechia ehrenbergii]